MSHLGPLISSQSTGHTFSSLTPPASMEGLQSCIQSKSSFHQVTFENSTNMMTNKVTRSLEDTEHVERPVRTQSLPVVKDSQELSTIKDPVNNSQDDEACRSMLVHSNERPDNDTPSFPSWKPQYEPKPHPTPSSSSSSVAATTIVDDKKERANLPDPSCSSTLEVQTNNSMNSTAYPTAAVAHITMNSHVSYSYSQPYTKQSNDSYPKYEPIGNPLMISSGVSLSDENRPCSINTNPSTSSLGMSPQLCSPSYKSKLSGGCMSHESSSTGSTHMVEEDNSSPKQISSLTTCIPQKLHPDGMEQQQSQSVSVNNNRGPPPSSSDTNLFHESTVVPRAPPPVMVNRSNKTLPPAEGIYHRQLSMNGNPVYHENSMYAPWRPPPTANVMHNPPPPRPMEAFSNEIYSKESNGMLINPGGGIPVSTNLANFVENNPRKFPCSKCKHVFDSSGEMKEHQLTHDCGQTFPCYYPKCDRQFKAESYLQNHIRRIHKNNKPITCFHCGFQTSKKKQFDSHMAREHKDCTLSCTVTGCPFRFHNEVEQQQHYMHEHTLQDQKHPNVSGFSNKSSTAGEVSSQRSQVLYPPTKNLNSSSQVAAKRPPDPNVTDVYEFSHTSESQITDFSSTPSKKGRNNNSNNLLFENNTKYNNNSETDSIQTGSLSTLDSILDDVVHGNRQFTLPSEGLDPREQLIAEESLQNIRNSTTSTTSNSSPSKLNNKIESSVNSEYEHSTSVGVNVTTSSVNINNNNPNNNHHPPPPPPPHHQQQQQHHHHHHQMSSSHPTTNSQTSNASFNTTQSMSALSFPSSQDNTSNSCKASLDNSSFQLPETSSALDLDGIDLQTSDLFDCDDVDLTTFDFTDEQLNELEQKVGLGPDNLCSNPNSVSGGSSIFSNRQTGMNNNNNTSSITGGECTTSLNNTCNNNNNNVNLLNISDVNNHYNNHPPPGSGPGPGPGMIGPGVGSIIPTAGNDHLRSLSNLGDKFLGPGDSRLPAQYASAASSTIGGPPSGHQNNNMNNNNNNTAHFMQPSHTLPEMGAWAGQRVPMQGAQNNTTVNSATAAPSALNPMEMANSADIHQENHMLVHQQVQVSANPMTQRSLSHPHAVQQPPPQQQQQQPQQNPYGPPTSHNYPGMMMRAPPMSHNTPYPPHPAMMHPSSAAVPAGFNSHQENYMYQRNMQDSMSMPKRMYYPMNNGRMMNYPPNAATHGQFSHMAPDGSAQQMSMSNSWGAPPGSYPSNAMPQQQQAAAFFLHQQKAAAAAGVAAMSQAQVSATNHNRGGSMPVQYVLNNANSYSMGSEMAGNSHYYQNPSMHPSNYYVNAQQHAAYNQHMVSAGNVVPPQMNNIAPTQNHQQ